MSAKKQQAELAETYAEKCHEIFSKEVMSSEDRVEIETLCALAIEMIKKAAPSVIRESGRIVEIRSYKDKIK